MGSLREIYEGWGNLMNKKEAVEKLAKLRLAICDECPEHSSKHSTPLRPDAHCMKCGCTLSAKTRSPRSGCPISKWEAVEK